jgi:hypothetical protein
LREGDSGHVDLLGKFQQPDDSPVGPLDSDQGAGIEDYTPRTLRAHAVTSSLAGPSSARISASTSAKLS